VDLLSFHQSIKEKRDGRITINNAAKNGVKKLQQKDNKSITKLHEGPCPLLWEISG